MHTYGGLVSSGAVGLGTMVFMLLVGFGCTPIGAPAIASSTQALTTAVRPTFQLHPATLQPSASEQPDATATLEPKMALHVFTDWALGPSESQTSRVKDIAYGSYEPGDIVFEWWLYNYPGADSMRGGARMDACTVLMGIVRGGVDYTSVVLRGYLPSGQVDGNSDEGRLVVSLTYSKATADGIDFDNSRYLCEDKIYELADRSLIAPELR